MAVTLSAFDLVFLEASWNWLQDEELRKLVDAPVITKEQQQSWFESLPQRTDYRIWGVLYDGQPIGVTGIKNILGTTGEYWGYIGDKNFWGKGVGSAMMQLTIAAAESITLKLLTLKVVCSNQRAIQLYHKIGFVETEVNETHIYMQKTLS